MPRGNEEEEKEKANSTKLNKAGSPGRLSLYFPSKKAGKDKEKKEKKNPQPKKNSLGGTGGQTQKDESQKARAASCRARYQRREEKKGSKLVKQARPSKTNIGKRKCSPSSGRPKNSPPLPSSMGEVFSIGIRGRQALFGESRE